MKTCLGEFIKHGFTTTFVRYDAAWIDLAAELADEAYELIASDVAAKYPAVAAEGRPLDVQLEKVLDCDAALQAAVLYRMEHVLYKRDPQHPALPYFAQFMRVRTTVELYYSSEIGPRLHIVHGTGAVIGPRNKIGSDFSFYQGVTLGQKRRGANEFITVGDGTAIYAGAKVIGAVRIGDNVRLGANAVLLTDAESNASYAGIPAVRIR